MVRPGERCVDDLEVSGGGGAMMAANAFEGAFSGAASGLRRTAIAGDLLDFVLFWLFLCAVLFVLLLADCVLRKPTLSVRGRGQDSVLWPVAPH